jgi:hypothetical protein
VTILVRYYSSTFLFVLPCDQPPVTQSPPFLLSSHLPVTAMVHVDLLQILILHGRSSDSDSRV